MSKLPTQPLALLAFLLVAFVTTTTTTGEPFRSSAAQQSLCNMTQDGLMACKPAITVLKPVAKPSDACCTALSHADLACLCYYKNSGFLPYLGIDPNLAMQLPAKCSVTAPEKC